MGDYIIFWQQIGHATDDDTWWINQISSLAGDKTTYYPESEWEDTDGTIEIIPERTEVNWDLSWVGGTTVNEVQYINGGENYKVMCISNYLERETRPNGDVIGSQSFINKVNPSNKVTNAQIQGLLIGNNPFRGGAAITNEDSTQAFIDEGFEIVYPPSDV